MLCLVSPSYYSGLPFCFVKKITNLKNSFVFDGDLTGKKVLIFDDIITSSNTIKEIIRTIEKANPKNIEILALASSHRVKK